MSEYDTPMNHAEMLIELEKKKVLLRKFLDLPRSGESADSSDETSETECDDNNSVLRQFACGVIFGSDFLSKQKFIADILNESNQENIFWQTIGSAPYPKLKVFMYLFHEFEKQEEEHTTEGIVPPEPTTKVKDPCEQSSEQPPLSFAAEAAKHPKPVVKSRNQKSDDVLENLEIDENVPIEMNGYSRTFRARSPSLGNVNVIRIDKMAKEEDVKNAREGYLMMKELEHPGILKVHDVIEKSEYIWVITGSLNNTHCLYDKVVAESFIEESQTREIVTQLLQVLRYLNTQGIVHRGISAEEINFDEETHCVKILRFDYAEKSDTNYYTAARGIPAYIAPEIMFDKYYTRASDLWSLGVLIYVMLSGFPPFFSNDPKTLMAKIRGGMYDFNDPFWMNVSDEARDLIGHLLENKVDRRYCIPQVENHSWMNLSDEKDSEVSKEAVGSPDVLVPTISKM